MIRGNWLAWFLLCVWAVWLHALQGWLGASIGSWAPELGLIFACSLASRLSTSDLPAIALCVGLSRAALSLDPIAAVLAAYFGAILFVRSVRAIFELTSPLVFAPAVGLAAFCVSIWLSLVRETRVVHALGLGDDALASAFATALVTTIASLVLGPWMAYLPGLSPLQRSSPWSSADSVR